MAAHGICKVKGGWVHEDSVWVQYDDGKKLQIPASQYDTEGYQPSIGLLRECTGEQLPARRP